MNIYEKLLAVQTELKAPKGQYNSFGKFRYRSQEDILEAVKPLLAKHGLVLTITDDIGHDDGDWYIKATAWLSNKEDEDVITVSSFAMISRDKKGMDASQMTGTASSYARKYALNGLFLIDDTKDADTDAYAKQTGRKKPEQEAEDAEAAAAEKIGGARALALRSMVIREGIPEAVVLDLYHVSSLENLTERQHAHIVGHLKELKAAADDRAKS